jgi:glyoxylase-like metal-dependent hydrolase (beta-lactamase superfamily II)
MNRQAPVVQPFHHADTGTWSYVVHDPGSRVAAIIDPVLDFDAKSGRTGTTSAQALADHVRDHALDVQWLLETHAHADHLSAAHALKSRHYPLARIAIGAGIRAVQAHFAPLFGLGVDAADGACFDHLLTDGETFALGDIAVRVIAVPGHTSDSNAFLIGDALFPGDSLFLPDSGTARCDFPGGDAATLYRSIQRLFALPDATRVFVCHDYGRPATGDGGREPRCETTIAAQKRDNIHVRDGIDEAAFVALRQARDATLAMPALILPALQVNLRAGALPAPEANGVRYLRIPLDRL